MAKTTKPAVEIVKADAVPVAKIGDNVMPERKEVADAIGDVIAGRAKEEGGLARIVVALAHFFKAHPTEYNDAGNYVRKPANDQVRDEGRKWFASALELFAPQYAAAIAEEKTIRARDIIDDDGHAGLNRLKRIKDACNVSLMRGIRTAFYLIDVMDAQHIELTPTNTVRVFDYREDQAKPRKAVGFTSSVSTLIKLADAKYKSGTRGTKSATTKAPKSASASDGKTTHAQVANVQSACTYLAKLTLNRTRDAFTPDDVKALQALHVQLTAMFETKPDAARVIAKKSA